MSKRLTNQLLKMARKEVSISNEILDKADKLPNAGLDCDCDLGDRITYIYIHDGQWYEVNAICLKCGGSFEPNY